MTSLMETDGQDRSCFNGHSVIHKASQRAATDEYLDPDMLDTLEQFQFQTIAGRRESPQRMGHSRRIRIHTHEKSRDGIRSSQNESGYFAFAAM
jgi:hypothetical protein